MPETIKAKHLGTAVAPQNTSGPLYVAPGGTTAILKEMVVCNVGTAEGFFSLYLAQGETATPDEALIYNLSVLPNETRTIADCSTVVEEGWRLLIGASQDASRLTATASGTEIVL